MVIPAHARTTQVSSVETTMTTPAARSRDELRPAVSARSSRHSGPDTARVSGPALELTLTVVISASLNTTAMTTTPTTTTIKSGTVLLLDRATRAWPSVTPYPQAATHALRTLVPHQPPQQQRLSVPWGRSSVEKMTKCPSCGSTGPFDAMAPGQLACGECGEVFDKESNTSDGNT
jgi:ribosomal protein S27AE